MKGFAKPVSEQATKVMVVDDDGPILQALRIRLNHEGFDVRTFNNGTSALQALDEFQPSVALLDINMPGLDGLNVASQIKTSTPECALVFLTASRDVSLRAKAANLGAHAYMEKPYAARELVECVRNTGKVQHTQ